MLALFITLALTPFAPMVLGLQPTPRWGHQAVYVPSEHAMYVIGGQVQTPGTQITNEVLVLPLNGTNPSYVPGPSTDLPPNAFAGAALSHDGTRIAVIGGVSANCSSDSIAHVYGITGNPGDSAWWDTNVDNLVRRRGSALVPIMDGGGEYMMLLGGIADTYSCATTTRVYPAADTLDIPLVEDSLRKSAGFPSDLTGSALAVSDFAVTTSPDQTKIYMVGGQAADGSLVGMDTMGLYEDGEWKSQTLGGSVPVGRIGATLVAHPSLDMLILHGGARNDRGNDLSTTLLAFLNTTTWEWSVPSHLQPPQVSAVSYHSAVMTPEGVMISSFGLNAAGSPRADTFYLDLRDPTQDGWTWKGQWNSDMATVIAEQVVEKPKRKIASIVAPIVILVVALPLAIWLIRRQVRINRKRRQARYFSFSSQEDEGEFGKKSFPWRSKSLFKRFTTGQKERGGEKNWEEIDFGLGRVDERRGSRPEARFTDQPMANGVTYTPAVHVYEPSDLPYTADPFADQGYTEGQVIPALTVQPPTAHPTPAAQPTETFPVARPLSSSSEDAQALDWSELEQSLNDRPAFRSISPTSTLRSHQPGHQLPERRPSTDRPALPPLDFGPRRSVSDSRPQSMVIHATPRSVSSPVSGRQIAGRRHSTDVQELWPVQSLASPVSSGYGTPQISTAVRFDARNMTRTGSMEYGSVPRDRPVSALRIANPSDEEA